MSWKNIIPSPIPVDPNNTLLNDLRLSDLGDSLRRLRREDRHYKPKEMPDIIRTTSFSSFNDIYGYGGCITDDNNFWNYHVPDGCDQIYAISVGPEVTTMENFFNGAGIGLTSNKLICAPACGPNVISMAGTYDSCYDIKGSPVCGPKVENLYCTYFNCYNLTGSPVCGPNVLNMAETYRDCSNLTGAPVCGLNVSNMCYAYSGCYNLTGSPVCGPNVIDMSSAYSGCHSLTGAPVCGPNVIDMSSAYDGCENLIGSPVCGYKVNIFSDAYKFCSNLTGAPVCGPNVTNMSSAYMGCSNLTGQPVCGPKVTDMLSAYSGCSNLNGSVIIEDNVRDASYCFDSCYNLLTICINDTNYTYLKNANLIGAFNRGSIGDLTKLNRMNVIVRNLNRYSNIVLNSKIWGCTLTKGSQNAQEIIEAPQVDASGRQTGVKIRYEISRNYYNNKHNLYVYYSSPY